MKKKQNVVEKVKDEVVEVPVEQEVQPVDPVDVTEAAVVEDVLPRWQDGRIVRPQ